MKGLQSQTPFMPEERFLWRGVLCNCVPFLEINVHQAMYTEIFLLFNFYCFFPNCWLHDCLSLGFSFFGNLVQSLDVDQHLDSHKIISDLSEYTLIHLEKCFILKINWSASWQTGHVKNYWHKFIPFHLSKLNLIGLGQQDQYHHNLCF